MNEPLEVVDVGFITVRNEVAKVMFLYVSVILSTGGSVLSACWDTTPSQEQTPPEAEPPPPRRSSPPPGRLLLRTVRILLECILVLNTFIWRKFLFIGYYFRVIREFSIVLVVGRFHKGSVILVQKRSRHRFKMGA